MDDISYIRTIASHFSIAPADREAVRRAENEGHRKRRWNLRQPRCSSGKASQAVEYALAEEQSGCHGSEDDPGAGLAQPLVVST